MNLNQKIVISAGAIMVLMLVFPPLKSLGPYGYSTHLGYGFLLFELSDANINLGLLLMQWLLVVALAIGALFVFKDRR